VDARAIPMDDLKGWAGRTILQPMNTQAYSTWLEVNLGAIKDNIKAIKKMTGTNVMAVIKANGYGHGVLAVAKAATEAGAAWCGVARMEEALNLREAGITSEIMVLGYTAPMMIPEAIQHEIHVAIYDREMAKAYADHARNASKRLKAHLKVETGMGRLGMDPEQVPDFLSTLDNEQGIEIDGIFTHFACADEPDSDLTRLQLSRFKQLLAELRKADLCPDLIHTANSAAIFGLNPSPGSPLPHTFRPALTWKARLTSVRTLPPGHGVSYGSIYVTTKEERIGVIPVGYGDGYRRLFGQQVIVHGKIVDVVGKVCMDQCMLQLDAVPEASPGDEVVLFGEQDGQKITVDDVAERWGTINYEVVCGLADRLPRLYYES